MNTKNFLAFSSGTILLNVDCGNILNNRSLSESSGLSETVKLLCKRNYLLQTDTFISVPQLRGNSVLDLYED